MTSQATNEQQDADARYNADLLSGRLREMWDREQRGVLPLGEFDGHPYKPGVIDNGECFFVEQAYCIRPRSVHVR